MTPFDTTALAANPSVLVGAAETETIEVTATSAVNKVVEIIVLVNECDVCK